MNSSNIRIVLWLNNERRAMCINWCAYSCACVCSSYEFVVSPVETVPWTRGICLRFANVNNTRRTNSDHIWDELVTHLKVLHYTTVKSCENIFIRDCLSEHRAVYGSALQTARRIALTRGLHKHKVVLLLAATVVKSRT